jgi:hypothetical protein
LGLSYQAILGSWMQVKSTRWFVMGFALLRGKTPRRIAFDWYRSTSPTLRGCFLFLVAGLLFIEYRTS